MYRMILPLFVLNAHQRRNLQDWPGKKITLVSVSGLGETATCPEYVWAGPEWTRFSGSGPSDLVRPLLQRELSGLPASQIQRLLAIKAIEDIAAVQPVPAKPFSDEQIQAAGPLGKVLALANDLKAATAAHFEPEVDVGDVSLPMEDVVEIEVDVGAMEPDEADAFVEELRDAFEGPPVIDGDLESEVIKVDQEAEAEDAEAEDAEVEAPEVEAPAKSDEPADDKPAPKRQIKRKKA